MSALPGAIHRRSVGPDVLRAGLFALAYFAGGELGYALSLGPSVGGTFWPPAGIALAVFLASPRDKWLLLVVAGLLANYASDLLHGQTLPASIAFAIANLGEPVLGALVLGAILRAPVTFTRLQEVVALGLVVAFVSAPAASALGALAAQWWTQNPPGFVGGWTTWWVGDAVGALVLTPCVLRLLSDWRHASSVSRRTWLEAAAYTLVLIAITQIVFTASATSPAMPFLIFPMLLWGSLRFGPIGVGAALCLVVVLATHRTVGGQGPFAAEHFSLGERLVALQIYVGVMAVTFHAMAVLWEERARAAAALRNIHSGLEARYRRIVEQAPFAILVVRADGSVREANPAWRRLLEPAVGADAEAKEQRPWEDSRLAPFLARAFAGQVVELLERDLSVCDERGQLEVRRVRGFAYPVTDEAGRVVEAVLIDQDVTEERRAQRQLEQLLDAERFARGEAERASQIKDEFLATLSHELRTPLNAIIGWTHLLRRGPDAAGLEQAVETIERNARAQAKLIEDLLDMSRIMAGKVGLTRTRLRLAEVMGAACNALRPVAAAKGVALLVDVPEAADGWISGDAARLQQVMTNLLGNGIKFTPPGGLVEARVQVGAHEARLIVRDNGQGIPAEFLPSVFDRFRQADASTTRRHGGLGLGLSIAKHIVEMHGGTIAAQSEGAGRGTTFIVTLPLAGELDGEKLDAGDALETQALADLRVLVVDDEADARELLRRLLLEQRCQVTIVASAEAALAEMGARRFDVLLTDIGMPAMDGYELLRRTRARIEAPPRAIAVTAFARPEDRARATAAGFDAHLPKPINPVQLVRLLAQLPPQASARNAL